jgi:hypothetical protein
MIPIFGVVASTPLLNADKVMFDTIDFESVRPEALMILKQEL